MTDTALALQPTSTRHGTLQVKPPSSAFALQTDSRGTGPGQSGDLSTSLHSVPGFGDARHDVLLSLMSWVENGTAPNQIIATKWRNDTLQDRVLRQRPLCMFPKQAVYRGHGDVNQAANWVCESLYGAGGY